MSLRLASLLSSLLLLSFLAVGCSGSEEAAAPAPAIHSATDAAEAGGEYFCPMHPEVRSDAEGTCPKCKMALVTKGGEHKHAEEAAAAPAAGNTTKPAGE